MNRLSLRIIMLVAPVLCVAPVRATPAKKLQELHGKWWGAHLDHRKLQSEYDANVNKHSLLERQCQEAEANWKSLKDQYSKLQWPKRSWWSYKSDLEKYYEQESELTKKIKNAEDYLHTIKTNVATADRCRIDVGSKTYTAIKNEWRITKEIDDAMRPATMNSQLPTMKPSVLTQSAPSKLPFFSTWKGGVTIFGVALSGYMLWRGGREGLTCLRKLDFRGFWHAVKTNGGKLPVMRAPQPFMPTTPRVPSPVRSSAHAASIKPTKKPLVVGRVVPQGRRK